MSGIIRKEGFIAAASSTGNGKIINETGLRSQDGQEVTFYLKDNQSISISIKGKGFIPAERVFIKNASIKNKLKEQDVGAIFKEIEDIMEWLKDYTLEIEEDKVKGRSIHLTISDF